MDPKELIPHLRGHERRHYEGRLERGGNSGPEYLEWLLNASGRYDHLKDKPMDKADCMWSVPGVGYAWGRDKSWYNGKKTPQDAYANRLVSERMDRYLGTKKVEFTVPSEPATRWYDSKDTPPPATGVYSVGEELTGNDTGRKAYWNGSRFMRSSRDGYQSAWDGRNEVGPVSQRKWLDGSRWIQPAVEIKSPRAPSNSGMYQVKFEACGTSPWYSWWNGENFGGWSTTKNDAWTIRDRYPHPFGPSGVTDCQAVDFEHPDKKPIVPDGWKTGNPTYIGVYKVKGKGIGSDGAHSYWDGNEWHHTTSSRERAWEKRFEPTGCKAEMWLPEVWNPEHSKVEVEVIEQRTVGYQPAPKQNAAGSRRSLLLLS